MEIHLDDGLRTSLEGIEQVWLFAAQEDESPMRRWRLPTYGCVNKSFLLARGWTRTAIKRILGDPDRRLVMRGRPPSRPECLYDVKRVREAERRGPSRFRRPPHRNDQEQQEETTVLKRCAYIYCRREFTLRRSTGRPRKYCCGRCRNRAAKKLIFV